MTLPSQHRMVSGLFDAGLKISVMDNATGSRNFRILMADDNRDAVDSMAMLLEIEGYDVNVAYTGQVALTMAAEKRPHVILLDIGMPDMSGHEVARAIRQTAWGASVYLIAITGWGDVEDKERARTAGFDRHLTKPVDPDQLGKLLHELMTQGSWGGVSASGSQQAKSGAGRDT